MKTGDNSPAVKQLQINLNKVLGTKVPETGLFANVTESAVRAFQQLNGLPVTGEADDATIKDLETKAGVVPPVVDKKAQALSLIEQALNLLKEAK